MMLILEVGGRIRAKTLNFLTTAIPDIGATAGLFVSESLYELNSFTHNI